MNIFPLEIFPYGSLAASVITTVWIGVCVVALFNLRFGWVLSGLVVPGYLVPLIIIRPVTAGVIVLESVVTYLIVYWWSEKMSAKTGVYCSLFGRDRFFALIVGSIAVRLVFDAFFLPYLGAWLVDDLGIAFDYRNSLRSFGLVIISLMANQYWKTGISRGLFVLIVTVGITWFIVRFGLLEYTNFGIGNLRFMYEDIAGSVMASPKAYIVLLTAALIASRMNLMYGWDFNGILLPSLIALQWYQPSKVLTSFAEAFIILFVGRFLLQTPLFARINMEGARLLLLFFNIGFAWKLLLGFGLPLFYPGIKVTDAYGFGYLLSTLLALKMHDKDIPARVTRATIQTSLTAVIVASLIGFLLTFLPQPWQRTQTIINQTEVSPESRPANVLSRVHADRIVLFNSRGLDRISVPLPREAGAFREGLDSIRIYARTRNPDTFRSAQIALAQANYSLELVESRYAYLVEMQPVKGWGLYIVDLDNPDGVTIQAPRALDERHSIGAAMSLFREMNAGTVALAGARFDENADGSADSLTNRDLPFQLFHRAFGKHNTVQVRGLTGKLDRSLARSVVEDPDSDQATSRNSLWITGSIPAGLNLVRLKETIPDLELHWNRPAFRNIQREEATGQFAELVLSRDTRRKVSASSLIGSNQVSMRKGDLRIDGYLREWLLNNRTNIAERATNVYVPPSVEQLLFFDEEVLTPLLSMIDESDFDSGVIDSDELRSIDQSARAIGYELLQYRHLQSNENFIILQESESTDKHYWGTYVFRTGVRRPYSIQVPRPLHEINSFEYAVSLFHRLQANTLLIAGANPDTNTDGSADLVRLDNRQNMVSLVNQVILRELENKPHLIIHSRAFGHRDDVEAPEVDVVASFAQGTPTKQNDSALSNYLLDRLVEDGMRYAYSGSDSSTAGYDTGGLAQSRYLDATRNKEFVALWLSPEVRSSYRQQNDNSLIQTRLRALGIEAQEADLTSELSVLNVLDPSRLPNGVNELLTRYIETNDVVTLRRLQRRWPSISLSQIVDRDTRLAFLVGRINKDTLAFVANLSPRESASQMTLTENIVDDVQRFVNRRAAILVPGVDDQADAALSNESQSDTR